MLDVSLFERVDDYVEHFTTRYGPTIAARANAGRNGREAEFDEALSSSRRSRTAARPTARASRSSTCSPSARGADSAGCAAALAAAHLVDPRAHTPTFSLTAMPLSTVPDVVASWLA